MGRLLWFLTMALTAAVVGTASAIYATQTLQPTGIVRIGPWEAITAVVDSAADPYAHAVIASSGQQPLGRAEGLRFVADSASDGSTLNPACSIVVRGDVGVAELWTLTLTRIDGASLQPAEPSSGLFLHSRDVVYNQDGSFELTIGPRPATPNVLAASLNSPVALVLHTYDETVANLPELTVADLPHLSVQQTGGGCA